MAAAVLGAQHLLDVGSLDDGGFVVPHTIPPAQRVVEPLTYTWCHGPAGTSQLFAALARAGVEEVGGLTVDDLRERCLHAVLTSGVPQRLRPGFWDNDGRCCGTAGVGDVLLDAAQDDDDPARAGRWLAGAVTMADALVERAVRDGDGAYWRFIEYRDDPPLLAPGTSWMQGAAGIAAYLFRIARVLDDGLTAPVVDRPDQWWAVPDALRTVGTVRPALDGAGTPMTTPEAGGPRWRGPAIVAAVAVLVLALVAGVVLLLGNDNGSAPQAAAGATSAPASSLPGALTPSSAPPTTPAAPTPTVDAGEGQGEADLLHAVWRVRPPADQRARRHPRSHRRHAAARRGRRPRHAPVDLDRARPSSPTTAGSTCNRGTRRATSC